MSPWLSNSTTVAQKVQQKNEIAYHALNLSNFQLGIISFEGTCMESLRILRTYLNPTHHLNLSLVLNTLILPSLKSNRYQNTLSKWFLCGAEGSFDKDEALAFMFAEKAVRKGLPSAEFAMGYYMEVGVGGSKDLDAARKWYTQAAQHGNADATEWLSTLDQAQALSCQEHDTLTEMTLILDARRRLPDRGQHPQELPRIASRTENEPRARAHLGSTSAPTSVPPSSPRRIEMVPMVQFVDIADSHDSCSMPVMADSVLDSLPAHVYADPSLLMSTHSNQAHQDLNPDYIPAADHQVNFLYEMRRIKELQLQLQLAAEQRRESEQWRREREAELAIAEFRLHTESMQSFQNQSLLPSHPGTHQHSNGLFGSSIKDNLADNVASSSLPPIVITPPLAVATHSDRYHPRDSPHADHRSVSGSLDTDLSSVSSTGPKKRMLRLVKECEARCSSRGTLMAKLIMCGEHSELDVQYHADHRCNACAAIDASSASSRKRKHEVENTSSPTVSSAYPVHINTGDAAIMEVGQLRRK
ncbi:hypothetical protein EW146_g3501 [Bondarzewia mesenterica]|uniref:Uncharacterized protein n=1 Tax=Bondarzewia mesenterica TaxID=1095465 RepID=A0A4S4LYV8_9AGAM|nr:hypothetical protein EW146_g3501 [Bondarzewia mesenterica]